MIQPRFTGPKGVDCQISPNLYVANCGPSVGISFNNIKSVFGTFGVVVSIHAADETGARVIICFSEASAAQAAFEALNGFPCPDLGGRTLHIRYSVPQPPQKTQSDSSVPVSRSASELAIPGIYLVHDFITMEEEQELLAAVDARPWQSLSKRRVQHYGYEFLYEVNEYPSGVGLSPHIDTHSAFEELIFSLSLSGPCIMEFRKFIQGTRCSTSVDGMKADDTKNHSEFKRKAVFLPPRSMLLLSGEGRYAWHHYIPHHKIDMVDGHPIRRNSRRVSFTFRKVRYGPCCCEYKRYCDSQREDAS